MEKIVNINEVTDTIKNIDSLSHIYASLAKLRKLSTIVLEDIDGKKIKLNLGGSISELMKKTIKETFTIHIENNKNHLIQLVSPEPAIVTSIKRNHFEAMKKKNWEYTYWFVDIHGTILKPNYEVGNIPTEYYPGAKETLKVLTKDKSIKLVLYTCSHPEEIARYVDYFAKDKIIFDFINENPEVKSDKASEGYGYYEDKPYINVLLDDKAGLNPEYDWIHIKDVLNGKFI